MSSEFQRVMRFVLYLDCGVLELAHSVVIKVGCLSLLVNIAQ